MEFNWIAEIRKQRPRIHCITNYVTANDVANMLLAIGGSPVMADDPEEAEDITNICSGLVLNLGTLNRNRLEAMIKAGKRANELDHPVVFDPVGAGASAFRTEAALKILAEVSPRVIRGNATEIKALAAGGANAGGVDAVLADRMQGDTLEAFSCLARDLSLRTGAVVAMTGENDLIADGGSVYVVRNGDPMMGRITGAGCMLDAVTAAFLSVAQNSGMTAGQAAALAVAAEGLCGELAAKKTAESGSGTSSFRMYLIDIMSCLTDGQLTGGARIEIR